MDGIVHISVEVLAKILLSGAYGGKVCVLTRSLDLERLKEAASSGRIQWQRHSLERMLERNISREEVKDVLCSGERIEDYPERYPWPSALFMGGILRPLHVVAALAPQGTTIAIVTVYEPTTEYFESDLRTRRRR